MLTQFLDPTLLQGQQLVCLIGSEGALCIEDAEQEPHLERLLGGKHAEQEKRGLALPLSPRSTTSQKPHSCRQEQLQTLRFISAHTLPSLPGVFTPSESPISCLPFQKHHCLIL